jgi:hypothetical protein
VSDALEDYPHTRDWATDAARRVVETWRSKGDGDNELQIAIAAVLREVASQARRAAID